MKILHHSDPYLGNLKGKKFKTKVVFVAIVVGMTPAAAKGVSTIHFAPRPEFVVNFCDKTWQLLPPTVGENHSNHSSDSEV